MAMYLSKTNIHSYFYASICLAEVGCPARPVLFLGVLPSGLHCQRRRLILAFSGLFSAIWFPWDFCVVSSYRFKPTSIFILYNGATFHFTLSLLLSWHFSLVIPLHSLFVPQYAYLLCSGLGHPNLLCQCSIYHRNIR